MSSPAPAAGRLPTTTTVTDDAMLAVALHLRGQELSLRDIAARLVIATGKKKGQHPSPTTVLRMLRDHDEKAAAAAVPTAADGVLVPAQVVRESLGADHQLRPGNCRQGSRPTVPRSYR